MAKKKFDGWMRDKTWVAIALNTENRLTLYFTWNIFSKKNSKRAFRGIVLPSANYVEWQRRMSNELKKNQFFYNKFPCKITIESISHDKRRADIDNKATSILDLLVDNGIIPDDNKFVVQELDIRNVGYAKNLALTKVVIEPYKEDVLELDQDFKEENWLNYIDLFIN